MLGMTGVTSCPADKVEAAHFCWNEYGKTEVQQNSIRDAGFKSNAKGWYTLSRSETWT